MLRHKVLIQIFYPISKNKISGASSNSPTPLPPSKSNKTSKTSKTFLFNQTFINQLNILSLSRAISLKRYFLRFVLTSPVSSID